MQNISHIQIVEGSREEKIVQAQTKDRIFSKIQLCGFKLNIHFPNGKIVFGEIISYHAIETGLFLWKYREIYPHMIDEPYYASNIIDRLANRFIGLSEHLIVTFSLQRVFLWIKDSSERYDTFEKAYEKGINDTLTKNVERIEEHNYYEEYRKIRLSDYIDDDFFSPLFSQRYVAKITKVTRQNASWEIKITGAPPPISGTKANRMWPLKPYDPNGSDNRKATFILSDDYEVLEVREEPVSSD